MIQAKQWAVCLPLLIGFATPVAAVRVKDLASVEGARENQLIGYGLVVGLAGTGDRSQAVFSIQSLTNLLQRMGVSISPSATRVRNTAAVMVTATLPPFAQAGQRIDVTTASLGDASSIQGGLLLLTPLKAADGEVYAVAQGALTIGGFRAGGQGNSQTLNHPTVGRISGGALVERTAPSPSPSSVFRLQLHRADFTTAARVSEAINQALGDGDTVARSESPGIIVVRTPSVYASRAVEFVSSIENLEVRSDAAARIVINERTGTLILGGDMRIRPVAILHGNLSVEIQTSYEVSQPAPLSGGETKVVPDVKVSAKEQRSQNIVLKQGASVEDLVKALGAIGSTPRDILSILESLKVAGALDAEIEVI